MTYLSVWGDLPEIHTWCWFPQVIWRLLKAPPTWSYATSYATVTLWYIHQPLWQFFSLWSLVWVPWADIKLNFICCPPVCITGTISAWNNIRPSVHPLPFIDTWTYSSLFQHLSVLWCVQKMERKHYHKRMLFNCFGKQNIFETFSKIFSWLQTGVSQYMHNLISITSRF